MHVDRSRFLLLTASLAAAACNQQPAPTTPDTSGDGDDAHRRQESSASAGAEAEDSPGSQTDPGAPQVWLEIEPGTEDRPEDLDKTCNNHGQSVPSCSSLRAPAGHCESFDSTLTLCDAYADVLLARPAAAATQCMLDLSGTPEICDWEVWQSCTEAGLGATCVDPRSVEPCIRITSQCGGSIPAQTCQRALSGVQPRHHSALTSCIQEFCELSFCISDLAIF